jgi:hypothetical protein
MDGASIDNTGAAGGGNVGAMIGTTPPLRLSDLPLWRLVVALHDAEEVAGPDSDSARVIRETIIDRLSERDYPRDRKGGDPCRRN